MEEGLAEDNIIYEGGRHNLLLDKINENCHRLIEERIFIVQNNG